MRGICINNLANIVNCKETSYEKWMIIVNNEKIVDKVIHTMAELLIIKIDKDKKKVTLSKEKFEEFNSSTFDGLFQKQKVEEILKNKILKLISCE